MNQNSIKIGKRSISSQDPCYVIAEIGVNHNGDLSLAHKLIDKAKFAGADAVKFQTFISEELVLSSAKKADYQAHQTGPGDQKSMLQDLELPLDSFQELKDHCTSIKLDFMSTAFDSRSLTLVNKLNPVCLKWPSGEINNVQLLKQAAKTQKPVILSTGMGSLAEVATALDILSGNGCEEIAILQCVSNYPASIEEQNLRTIPNMSAIFGRPTGLSDHTVGPYAAIAARALGMAILEKHFTLDKGMEGPDHAASSTPKEFKHLVEVLRSIETGLGSGIKGPALEEENVRKVARKSIVYQNDLLKGSTLSEKDLTSKRPGTGVAPNWIDFFIGMKLQRNVSKNQMLKMEDFR